MQKPIISRNTVHHLLPHLGQRIVKTSLAVFICLIIYYLRGFYGESMPTESLITAIICMQHYARDTRQYALNRLAGSLIGALLGLLFLLILLFFPKLGNSPAILYALMAAGTLVALYSGVLLRMPDISSLAAIVFLCVVISFPDISNPVQQAINRMFDVFIGTAVAICVNVFRLPRRKNSHILFFLHARDLAPDKYSQINPTAMFRLNYLYNEGAKICLISEHAPAFFILQLNNTKVNTPLIVMGGAAIYDFQKNTYLWKEIIPVDASRALIACLERHGLGYFVYTIHKNRTCIFHYGPINEDEAKILERMKHSHYRYYLEESSCDPTEIVYFKLVYSNSLENPALNADLDAIILRHHLNAVSRTQVSAPDAHGLYIYGANATIPHAEETLLSLMQANGRHLNPCEIKLEHGYQTDHDSIHLLNLVWKRYEPFIFSPKRAE